MESSAGAEMEEMEKRGKWRQARMVLNNQKCIRGTCDTSAILHLSLSPLSRA